MVAPRSMQRCVQRRVQRRTMRGAICSDALRSVPRPPDLLLRAIRLELLAEPVGQQTRRDGADGHRHQRHGEARQTACGVGTTKNQF